MMGFSDGCPEDCLEGWNEGSLTEEDSLEGCRLDSIEGFPTSADDCPLGSEDGWLDGCTLG